MTQKDTGGPAFPADDLDEYFGMTLRDYFAGGASDIDISEHQVWTYDDEGTYGPTYTREQARYRYADAMIAARKETT